MIKFFRKIRQNLLSEGKTVKYFKYAIGEIILVVIGILIALSINNLSNNIKDRNLEKQYISSLINDLQDDSIVISEIKMVSNEQVKRKNKLIEYFEGKEFTNDSIAHFFSSQWEITYEFNPITITIDELKSTGRIGLIQNSNTRKQIIKTYNTYENFTNNFQSYYERGREELRQIALKIPRVFDDRLTINSKTPDIIDALNNDELKNRVLANYAVTLNEKLQILQDQNRLLIKQLKQYESDIQK
ncbi:DUF6090 family protein [Croceitalea sp. P059]|uniref:DUF6090 family protein n=1 Tax=Croceitalea sp. P059 TaxID=3075601 RepID=UPI0028864342|nr:DUF6090 family protein [Croceitalea sp. P059]MDT0540204.1 DUF6090 family protein [Croceitalea sp. P059]